MKAAVSQVVGAWVLASALSSSAQPLLMVHNPMDYFTPSSQAYIDSCEVEVEPYGAYVRETVTLSYSDHGAWPDGRPLELVHRFRLPEKAVINDLWLWMPDTVMRAIVVDTWTAQAMYDSVVSRKRDPAHLSKGGDYYRLQVYPLRSGSSRRVRIQFVVPSGWYEGKAVAPLPAQMLQADPTATPVMVRFCDPARQWDIPTFLEWPDVSFSLSPDTSHGLVWTAAIPDVHRTASLRIAYKHHFADGVYFRSFCFSPDTSMFELGLVPKDLFHLTCDTSATRYSVAIDLSGEHGREPAELLDHLKNLLHAILRPKDAFRIVGVCNGEYFNLSPAFRAGSASAIDSAMDSIESSRFYHLADSVWNPRVLFCDEHAWKMWGPAAQSLRVPYRRENSIRECLGILRDFDVVASYDHGYEQPLTDSEAAQVLAALDSFFAAGGRFVTFFDYNRDGHGKIASALIPGLRTRRSHLWGYVHGVPGTPAGDCFPQQAWATTINELTCDEDPFVTVDVVDDAGQPVVITKRIHSGFLVVSGLWSFVDDYARRFEFGKALLGLCGPQRHRQLPELLDSLALAYTRSPFDRALLLSNSEELVAENAADLVSDYLTRYTPRHPLFHTVNLLKPGTFSPPYLRIGSEVYYGSGYFEKLLSDSTGGYHFEMATQTWFDIQEMLLPGQLPAMRNLSVQWNTPPGHVSDWYSLWMERRNAENAVYFIGEAVDADSLRASVELKLWGRDTLYATQLGFPLGQDTAGASPVLPAMLANERILRLLSQDVVDTAEVVRIAVRYHLLTDFTSMVCLEPRDTTAHPGPQEEPPPWTRVANSRRSRLPRSVSVAVYPNPFNPTTRIAFTLPYPARVRICIYDLNGRLVRIVDRFYNAAGRYVLVWDATDDLGVPLSSGVYLVRFEVFRNGRITTRTVRKVTLIR